MVELMEENNIVLTEDEKVTLELWHSIVGPIVAKKALDVYKRQGQLLWNCILKYRK